MSHDERFETVRDALPVGTGARAALASIQAELSRWSLDCASANAREEAALRDRDRAEAKLSAVREELAIVQAGWAATREERDEAAHAAGVMLTVANQRLQDADDARRELEEARELLLSAKPSTLHDIQAREERDELLRQVPTSLHEQYQQQQVPTMRRELEAAELELTDLRREANTAWRELKEARAVLRDIAERTGTGDDLAQWCQETAAMALSGERETMDRERRTESVDG